MSAHPHCSPGCAGGGPGAGSLLRMPCKTGREAGWRQGGAGREDTQGRSSLSGLRAWEEAGKGRSAAGRGALLSCSTVNPMHVECSHRMLSGLPMSTRPTDTSAPGYLSLPARGGGREGCVRHRDTTAPPPYQNPKTRSLDTVQRGLGQGGGTRRQHDRGPEARQLASAHPAAQGDRAAAASSLLWRPGLVTSVGGSADGRSAGGGGGVAVLTPRCPRSPL